MHSESKEQCDVWIVRHHVEPTDVWRASSRLLSANEQERLERFLNPRAKYEYCLTRAALRCVLGDYLETDAASLRFGYSEHGKPFVDDHLGGRHVEFNVAHTRELSIIAVTESASVGVDVEAHRNVESADRIVSTKFSVEEQDQYLAASPSERLEVFFRGWTRKEAFIKATGEGLVRPLASFAVTIADPVDVRFLRIDDDTVSAWRLEHLDLSPSHTGAVAVRSTGLNIVRHELSWDQVAAKC